MTTTDLQRSFDGVLRNLESSCQRTNGPPLFVQKCDGETITVCELGISPSPLIDRLRDGFDVLRVYTQTVATKVVGLKSLRPRPHALFPHRTMRYRFSSSESNLTITALAHSRSMPDPAGSRITSVLDRKVPLINQPDSRHTSTPYQTFSMRVEEEGYEAP